MIFNILLTVASIILFIDIIITIKLLTKKEVFCLTRLRNNKNDLIMISRNESKIMNHLNMMQRLSLHEEGTVYQLERKDIE